VDVNWSLLLMLAMLVCILDIHIIIILLLYVFVFFNFFFLDMVSLVLDSQDNGRRKWTPEEDIKLVQALLEHYNEGNDK
jgi:hypothetical protein